MFSPSARVCQYIWYWKHDRSCCMYITECLYVRCLVLLLRIFDQESGILFFIVTYVSNTVDYFASECAMSDSNLFDVIIQGIKYNLLERV
jgi:hypothetical protein